ncbi:MAG: porin family protein [Desulfobacteraceae bacterium]|nr:porin family protein [Desulfobacteraceae bacterium]
MKRWVLGFFFCTMILSIATMAHCEEYSYIRPYLGGTILSNSDMDDSGYAGTRFDVDYEPGITAGVAIGHDFGRFMVEGEATYQTNGVQKIITKPAGGGSYENANVSGNAVLFALFCNVYYKFIKEGAVLPYVMAGLGRGSLAVEGSLGNDSDSLFTYQAGAGVGIRLTDKLNLDVRYRYLKTDTGYFNTTHISYGGHSGIVGLSIKF